jgi:hypothetical protein
MAPWRRSVPVAALVAAALVCGLTGPVALDGIGSRGAGHDTSVAAAGWGAELAVVGSRSDAELVANDPSSRGGARPMSGPRGSAPAVEAAGRSILDHGDETPRAPAPVGPVRLRSPPT